MIFIIEKGIPIPPPTPENLAYEAMLESVPDDLSDEDLERAITRATALLPDEVAAA
jgi:hypothetical protein